MIKKKIQQLNDWCKEQDDVRLVLGRPVNEKIIDQIPVQIQKKYPYDLSVPFNPNHFRIPAGYKEFLSLHEYARIEFKNDEEDWEIYEPFNIFTLQQIYQGPSFTPSATLNNKQIYTTFLVAFATAGYATEASRWCFYTDPDIKGKKNELPILCEANDYECNLAKYVETKNWVENPANQPAALSFEDWLDQLVKVITQNSFDPERNDEIPASLFRKGSITD